MALSKKMLVEDWIKVTDNPIQRDTERHAAKARHLLTPHPTHSVVHAAELPSGKLYKLDGHTRALLWKRKQVVAPMQVTVLVYPVKDMAEVEQLYKDFDSSAALETTRDKVYGAFNKHNFDPKSDLLNSGQITYALRQATAILYGIVSAAGGVGNAKDKDSATYKVRNLDVYSMIQEWSYELHALDAFGLGRSALTSGITAAFLVSYRKFGAKVTPFWTGVFANQGMKTGGQMDAIQSLTELMIARKGNGFNGSQAVADLCSRALRAIEHWLKDEMLVRIPMPMDLTGYLSGYEKPLERLIKGGDIERARIDRERAAVR